MGKAEEILKKYQEATIDDVSLQTPAVICSEMITLSSNIAEWADKTTLCEQALSKKWEELRKNVDTDGRADRLLKGTQEYADLMKCRANEKAIIETIRSLKKLLQSRAEEAHNYY